MRIHTGGVGLALRRMMPRSLLGRSLIIILAPMVILQAIALQIFYGTHIEIVSRRLSAAWMTKGSPSRRAAALTSTSRSGVQL